MKLVTWNCQGGFRNKANIVLALQPDILVVQECEHPDKLLFDAKTPKPTDFLWFGDNPHKGIGIFSFSDFRFNVLDEHNPDFKIVVPISVSNGQFSFTLFAIWANNPEDKANQYIQQVGKAIHHYDLLLNHGPTILTGDFNSNSIWDKKHRIINHSTVVNLLSAKNIFSLYHRHLNEEQGKETVPTFYLQRKQHKPYHIDYCFASSDLHEKVLRFEIGTFENWITYSDHIPLVIDFMV